MLSNKTLFQLLIGIFLSVVTGIILFMAINSSISCIDKNGCLRSWCDFSWLKYEYQKAINELNTVCPFQQSNNRYYYTFMRSSDPDENDPSYNATEAGTTA